MNGSKLKMGVSVMVVAVLASGVVHAADGKPRVRPAGEVLNERPSAYGASGAQGVYMARDEVKVKNLPAHKHRTRDGDCPDGALSGDHPDLPAHVLKEARPNQCYAKLLRPPVVETYADRVMVEPERTEKRVIPAEVRWVERKVVVEPERIEKKVIPAVTRKVVEEKVIEEAYEREEVIPAVYEKRVERVEVRPARREWVRSEGIATGAALVTPGDHQPVRYRADGMLTWPGKHPVDVRGNAGTTEYLQKGSAQTVWCLKEYPAEYDTVERKVVVQPESVRRIRVPAKVKKVERIVVDREEEVIKKVIPAVYKIDKVKEVVRPERVETYTVPAVYKSVEKARAAEGPEPVWREVICDKNTSVAQMKEIQYALKKRGYDPGPIDGQAGSRTVAAMQKFQADQGLPQGQMSVEAAEALGVRIR